MASSTTAQDAPSTAKTLIFDIPTKTLKLQASRPVPTPDHRKDEHLVRVRTTALCSGELEWPTLFPAAIFPENPDKQVTPGYDLAGVVVASPPGSPFRPGNAATVPLSAITAWQALFQHAGVDGLCDSNAKGKTVLVTAAAGGVGVWLIQLASLAGLEVIAQIGSAENGKFVTELGASKTVNYKTTSLKKWTEEEGPFDIVIDLLGRKTIVEPPEGRKPEQLESKNIKSLFFIMEPNGGQLAEVSKLLDEEKCKPVLDSVWSLDEYKKAFDRLDGGHARGKVVIKVSE
ncbi:hypothetical protein B0A49_11180 [Cryomyces minteri]|uniref:Enoyl reductase (ER) domain-containing protein n=1 Tax=Cryomyces minteri TaxID=331657 RepID=A0A4U0W196_9PEZI|nr:hypothetical protein B0A49_11180 [Cryomyces minteri]